MICKKEFFNYISNFKNIEEIDNRFEELQGRGFYIEYYDKHSFSVKTPSGRDLSVSELEDFICNTRLKVGEEDHIENLKATEFFFIQKYNDGYFPDANDLV